MSRGEAKRRFTVADHIQATAGVECRKDADVIDETPMAYKSIDAVMEAQKDLVDVVHTLRQGVCVKVRERQTLLYLGQFQRRHAYERTHTQRHGLDNKRRLLQRFL
jgi:tRNA-splicing ligase RtcB